MTRNHVARTAPPREAAVRAWGLTTVGDRGRPAIPGGCAARRGARLEPALAGVQHEGHRMGRRGQRLRFDADRMPGERLRPLARTGGFREWMESPGGMSQNG